MEEKLKILMELDKKTVQAAAYWANIDLSDEVWQKKVAEPNLFRKVLLVEQIKEMKMWRYH